MVGFLLKYRGAVESPDIEWRRPLRSSLRLFRSRAYALGMGVATASGTAAAVAGWQTVTGASLVAAAAGLLWGASDVSIKALSGTLGDNGIAVLVHPLALVILLLSLYGLVVSTRSLQRGRAVPVIAV